MNARQKAKYFKKKYEKLLAQPVKATIVNHRIVKLRCQSKMQKFDVTYMPSTMINAVLTEENSCKMFDEVKQYITSSCHRGPDNSIVMESELSVVDLRGENE